MDTVIPDTAEIIVLAIICAAIFGLLKLDLLGEWFWRLRCALDPSLETSGADASSDSADRSDKPD